MRVCEICGRTSEETSVSFRKIYNRALCSKHETQMRKYGHILQRTIHDPNEIIEKDDYAEVVLRNKKHEIVGIAKIDKDDIDLCKKYKWRLDHGYVSTDTKERKKLYMHRLIMGCFDIDKVIDHRGYTFLNGKNVVDKLDNRKKSLKVISEIDNGKNNSLRKDSTSLMVGVSKNKGRKKYSAYIDSYGKRIHLGEYAIKKDAIGARIAAEKILNFNIDRYKDLDYNEVKLGKKIIKNLKKITIYRNDLSKIRFSNVRSKKNNGKSDLQINEYIQICMLFKNDKNILCAYCSKKLKYNNKTLDHIIPINDGGISSIGNVLCVCRKCNNSKNKLEFTRWFRGENFYKKEIEDMVLDYMQNPKKYIDTKLNYLEVFINDERFIKCIDKNGKIYINTTLKAMANMINGNAASLARAYREKRMYKDFKIIEITQEEYVDYYREIGIRIEEIPLQYYNSNYFLIK